MSTTDRNYTTVTVVYHFPHLGEGVDLDAQEDLRSRVRDLRNDYESAARILGCELEELSVDVEVSASVDFGAKAVH